MLLKEAPEEGYAAEGAVEEGLAMDEDYVEHIGARSGQGVLKVWGESVSTLLGLTIIRDHIFGDIFILDHLFNLIFNCLEFFSSKVVFCQSLNCSFY